MARVETTAVILAGGLGSRLGRAVSQVPKPMLPVLGVPFLQHLLVQIREAGCDHVVLCVGYLREVIEEYFQGGAKLNMQIEYSVETRMLGTAGAVVNAMPLIRSDPFLLLNGDSYCSVDFPALLAFHKQHRASATIVASLVKNAMRFGTLDIDADDGVLAFHEKKGGSGAAYVNAGIYALCRDTFASIPMDQPYSLERQVFPQLIGRGLICMRTTSTFLDIGTPESLEDASTTLLRLRQAIGHPAEGKAD